MHQKTANTKCTLRLAALAVVAMLLGGCSTYYQSYYPDSGVYYEDSGVYGHSSGYPAGGYGPVNPVDYPYWSIDYFYFSQYYHPYSVYVGYSEPLYYPYPGWALGHYRPARWHGSLAFGFGYPWHGYGYRYPAYTFGFFSGYYPYHYGRPYSGHGHDRDRIRQIDRRLEALQRGDSYASRRALVGRDRVARDVRGGLYDSRDTTRSKSRAELMRQRSTGAASSRQRQSTQRNATAPDRRIQRRAPAARSDRRVLDRDRIRREGTRDGTRSAYEGHRGIPIDGLRGRVGVTSRSSRANDTPDRDVLSRDRGAAQRNIRRAPAVNWDRSERQSRQDPGRAARRVENPARGNWSNRPTRSSGSPVQRPDRRVTAPPRAASPPKPTGRASSSPSRGAVLRQRSGGSDVGRNGGDSRGGNRGGAGREARRSSRRNQR